ncbi:hypothetical protein [Helicobacter felis]|uniref:hypothetical protein n=1 Tax=Helicobacter felis TaxID=214 RepID=UPI000CF09C1D|nr:hypothetical protein [Helicobacter felis]
MIFSTINKKGGVGKTAFSFSIAKDLKLFLQSNDNSIIESLYPNKTRISAHPSLLQDCVYDFGGFIERGVLDIARNSDAILIPCTPLYNAVLRTIESIQELQSIAVPLIVLITDFQSQKEKEQVVSTLQSNFTDLHFFFFKHSRILENSMRTGLSFKELAMQTPLAKLQYKTFIDEYQCLLETLQSKGKQHG